MRDGATRLLDARAQCLLAAGGESGPLLVPVAHWYDGQYVWLTILSRQARGLAEHPACAVCVPGGDASAMATGTARLFGVDDPVGLAVHAGPIAGALAALALRNAPALLGHARNILLTPARLVPRNRVVVRVRVDDAWLAAAPEVGPGIAPPLPAAVPADVRRALGGERRVIVAAGSDRPQIVPAVWDAGFELRGPGHQTLDVAGPVAVAVDAPAPSTEGHRLVLFGSVAGGRLTARRASWWHGLEHGSVDVPAQPAGGVVLPD